jgi:molybdate transport system ATP-binding protein
MTTGLEARFEVTRGTHTITVAVSVEAGHTLAVVGPNGSGKSTLLRAVAGLLPIYQGYVRLNGRDLDAPAIGSWVPPEHRRIGVVHQDYLLFEHLSVVDNVAFGPRCHGVRRDAARARARHELARVGLVGMDDARPLRLSGGQRQRVALARALAVDPLLLLLDEPLAALDASVSATVRGELSRHLRTFPGASILVTHDPMDALLLGDHIAVLEDGRIVQHGTPAEIAHRPASDYVARLLGLQLLRGVARNGIVALDEGGQLHIVDSGLQGRVILSIRPAAVSFHRVQPEGSARNVWRARVTDVTTLGDRVRVSVSGAPSMVGDITPAALTELQIHPDGDLWLSLKATEIDAFADGVP